MFHKSVFHSVKISTDTRSMSPAMTNTSDCSQCSLYSTDTGHSTVEINTSCHIYIQYKAGVANCLYTNIILSLSIPSVESMFRGGHTEAYCSTNLQKESGKKDVILQIVYNSVIFQGLTRLRSWLNSSNIKKATTETKTSFKTMYTCRCCRYKPVHAQVLQN